MSRSIKITQQVCHLEGVGMPGMEDMLGIGGIDGMFGIGDIEGMPGIGLVPGIEAGEPMQGMFFISSFMVFILASIDTQQSFLAGCQLEGANSRNRPAPTMKIPTATPVMARVGNTQRDLTGRVLVRFSGPASVPGWSAAG
ncbi:hypothetical protein A5656_11090 [Mycobacterium gordonae]|nr:hypothetical protein A5656_11090 [Mycobacterium gordonae]